MPFLPLLLTDSEKTPARVPNQTEQNRTTYKEEQVTRQQTVKHNTDRCLPVLSPSFLHSFHVDHLTTAMLYGVAKVKNDEPGRLISIYSELQIRRLNVPLSLPSVLKNSFHIVDGPPSSAAGNPGTVTDTVFISSYIHP